MLIVDFSASAGLLRVVVPLPDALGQRDESLD